MQFPDRSAMQVHAATAECWDLSGPLPVPKGDWLACPVCRAADPQPRQWMFHERGGPATVPYRCDVSFKCVRCAAVWTHGVAVGEAYFQRHAAQRVNNRIGWREARLILEHEPES